MSHHSIDRQRAGLGGLPRYTPPGHLHDRLRVLASRESLRNRRRMSVETLLAHWRERFLLFFHNLMRPFAVPVAGGLLSAIVLFGLLAPQFAMQRSVAGDVPTGLTTMATVESSMSFDMFDEDIAVDVVIDGQGRVIDYSIPRGESWASDPALVRSIEMTLLYTKFTPATMFGMPASGKTRITLRRSHVEVRG